MKQPILKWAASAASGLILAGCITHEQTVVRDAERVKVEFENETAARIFYEALSRAPGHKDHAESTAKFEIPVLFEYHRHVVTGSNVAFNRAVEICDSNKDGKITEQEARIYAEQAGK
ncbi:MAG: hypothetical protein ABSF95_03940 [Verrucomicrobiota bacterium]|jgi:hypothetical protein